MVIYIAVILNNYCYVFTFVKLYCKLKALLKHYKQETRSWVIVYQESGYKFFRSSLIVSWVGCKCVWERVFRCPVMVSDVLATYLNLAVCVRDNFSLWSLKCVFVCEGYPVHRSWSLKCMCSWSFHLWCLCVCLCCSLMCVWLVGQITRSLRYVCYILCDKSASSSTCGGSIWISSITCLINSERSF